MLFDAKRPKCGIKFSQNIRNLWYVLSLSVCKSCSLLTWCLCVRQMILLATASLLLFVMKESVKSKLMTAWSKLVFLTKKNIKSSNNDRLMNKRINYFLDAHPKAITLKWIKQFLYRLLYLKKSLMVMYIFPSFWSVLLLKHVFPSQEFTIHPAVENPWLGKMFLSKGGSDTLDNFKKERMGNGNSKHCLTMTKKVFNWADPCIGIQYNSTFFICALNT